MSRLRAAQIITTSALLMACSGIAQSVPASPDAMTQPDAVAKARDLLIQAAQTLEQASQQAKKPSDTYTWGDLAFAAARANDVNLAIRAATASHQDSDSISRVAVVLMKNGSKKEAYEVLGLLAGGEPSITPELIACETLIESQIASGDLPGAKETLALMQKVAGPEPEEAIQIYLKDAQKKIAQAQPDPSFKMDFPAALDAAKKIPDPGERGLALITIGIAQMQKGDRAGAAETLKLGDQSLSLSKDPAARSSGFRALSGAEARLGNVKRALEIARGLSSSDVYLMGMNSRALALEQIAFEQARAGDAAGAFETVQRLQLDSSRFEVLEGIARWQLRQRDTAAALRTCQKILDLPVKADFRKSSDYLEVLLRTAKLQQEAGNGPLAGKTLAQVVQEAKVSRHDESRVLLLKDIAAAQAGFGDFEGAREEADLLPDMAATERIEAITLIAVAQAEKKQFSGAVDTMATALARCSKSTPPSPGCAWANYAFADVLRALARLGDEEDALKWANARSSPSDKAKALIGVAQGLLDRVSPDDTETAKGRDVDELKKWDSF